jgi:hypothetical protein
MSVIALFRPRRDAPGMMLLVDRSLLRRTPKPDPIRRVQSVVTRPARIRHFS